MGAFAKGNRGAVGVSNDIGTSPDIVQLTSFTSQDLLALSPGGISCPRGLMVSNVGAGTKVLEIVTAAGQTRTLDATNLQGAYLPIAAQRLTANTTVTSVLVFF